MSHPDRNNESFLQRWSRRKRAPEMEDPSRAHDTMPADGGDADTPSAGEDPPGEEVLPDDLKDFSAETLDVDNTDFSRFLKEDVPEDIRRAALRKLWESDDVLANLDGLNEYDEDFTPAGMLQAARDFLWRVSEMSEKDDVKAESASSMETSRVVEQSSAHASGEEPLQDDESAEELDNPKAT